MNLVTFTVTSFGHTGITIVDLEKSSLDVEKSSLFWRDRLGFKEILNAELSGEFASQITGIEGTDTHFAILGGSGPSIELVRYRGPEDRQHLRPRPSDVGSLHVALVVDTIDAVLADVAAFGRHAPGSAQTVPDGPFAGTSFVYMHDPDGTVVELIQPPAPDNAGHSH
jgi:glyoxylase I family protein